MGDLFPCFQSRLQLHRAVRHDNQEYKETSSSTARMSLSLLKSLNAQSTWVPFSFLFFTFLLNNLNAQTMWVPALLLVQYLSVICVEDSILQSGLDKLISICT